MGTYSLHFVRVLGTNEGGLLVNGGSPRSEAIEIGDLDSLTFTATVGEDLILRAGRTGGTLGPVINVSDPSGAPVSVANSACGSAGMGRYSGSAPATGKNTAVVYDCTSPLNNTGTYDLHFTRSTGASEGGSLADGSPHVDFISIGDLDSYQLPVSAGDSIHVRVQRVGQSSLTPGFRVYAPSGAIVGSAACSSPGTAELAFTVRLALSVLSRIVANSR